MQTGITPDSQPTLFKGTFSSFRSYVTVFFSGYYAPAGHGGDCLRRPDGTTTSGEASSSRDDRSGEIFAH